MAEMFKNMQELRRLSGDTPPEFLLTHPVTTRRIPNQEKELEKILKMELLIVLISD